MGAATGAVAKEVEMEVVATAAVKAVGRVEEATGVG